MDAITITGVVGSDPRHHVTAKGVEITSFRLASTHRYFDRAKGAWESGGTNWYTVSSFRQLAANTLASIKKGEHVVVHGRLRLRDWEAGEKSGLAVEIDADAIGHDLMWGRSSYQKLASRSEPNESRTGDEGTTSTEEATRTQNDAPDAATDAWASTVVREPAMAGMRADDETPI